jgi:hypothetical protein
MRRHIGIFLIVGLAVFATAGSALAAFPGRNGKIAFEAQSGRGIWTVNPDGTGRTRLTTFGFAPKWSPDGTKLAFDYDGVWVMNADGTGLRRLRYPAGSPSWSPDGTKIVYTEPRAFQWGLWVMDADGSGATRITDGAYDTQAAWSPDGSQIVFIRDYYRGNMDAVNADGSNRRELLQGYARAPDWSPDGGSIVLNYSSNVAIFEQGTVRPTDAKLAGEAAWSPDGSKIVFSGGGANHGADLFVMDRNGTNPVNITNTFPADTGDTESAPAWQPLPNRPPDCSDVGARPGSLLPANRRFRLITLTGGSDPDGDPVELSVTGVTQDEPVTGRGDPTAPDARRASSPDQVFVRAERSNHADGRVYRISFTGSDGKSGTCSGSTRVDVPRHKHRTALESPGTYDSFAAA